MNPFVPSQADIHEPPFPYGEAFEKLARLSSSVVHLHHAPTWQLLYTNPALKAVLGYEMSEINNLPGGVISVVCNPDQLLADFNTKSWYQEGVTDYVWRARHKYGAIRVLRTRASVFSREASGEPREILCWSEDITQAYEADCRLNEREMLLAETESVLNYGIWEWVPDTGSIYWTEGMYRLFGWTDHPIDEALKQRFRQIIHPEDLDKVDQASQQAVLHKASFDFEFRALHQTGQWIQLLVHAKVIDNALAGGIKIISSIIDITDQRNAQEEKAEKNVLLAETEKILNYGSWSWDVLTDRVDWSDGYWRMLGYNDLASRPAAITAAFYLKHIHPDNLAVAQEKLAGIVTRGEVVEMPESYRFITCDGRNRIIISKTRIVSWKNGKPARIVTSAVDVTDREESLLTIIRNEALHSESETLFKYGSWEYNILTGKNMYSENMYQILGWHSRDPDDLTRNFVNHIHPEDRERVQQAMHETATLYKPYAVEYRYLMPADGRQIILRARGKIIWNDKGEAARLIGNAADVTEQRKMEEKMRRTELILAETEQLLSHGSWESNHTTGELVWSAGMYRVFDLDPTEPPIPFEKLSGYLAEHEPTRITSVIEQARQNRTPYDFESVITTVKGNHKYIYVQGKPYFNAAGTVIGFVGSTTDITQQKNNLAVIEKNQLLLSAAESLSKMGSWEWNAHTGTTRWSDGMYRIYEKKQNETPLQLEQFLHDYCHPDDVPKMEKAFAQVLENRASFELEYRINIGQRTQKVLFARCQPILDTNGRITGLLGSTTDITEQKKVLNQTLERKALLYQAEKLLSYGSWSWEPGQRQFICSEGLWNILGYGNPADRPDRVTPFFLKNHIHPEDRGRIIALVQHFIKTGTETDGIEYRLVNKQGQTKVVVSRMQVLAWEGNRPERVINSVADITAIKQVQHELENRVKDLHRSNAELEQFAYVASHDLQEPLRKIISFGNLIKQTYQPVLGDDGKLWLERMEAAAGRMKILIEDLLRFSRVGRKVQSFATVDLAAVMTNVLSELDMAIRSHNAHVEVEPLPVIEAIPVEMHQLLMNLISNALKFAKPGEPCRVTVTSQDATAADTSRWRFPESTLYLKIKIQDNGIGFEPEYAEKIFIIFQRLHGRTEYEGSGIGLAICKKIVEYHKGIIYAESQPGQGAVFTILLPARQPDESLHPLH